jgi:hypothetical protein
MIKEFRWYLVVLAVGSCLLSCSQKPKPQDQYQPEDSVLANVFKPLDGTWQGKFLVYKDRRGQIDGRQQPKPIAPPIFNTANFEVFFEVSVTQRYQSKNPFYQTVSILDVYTNSNGVVDTVRSEGYNQVKDGKLRCVVHKPGEQVVHEGYLMNDSTIVWERSLADPLKVEYFQETVNEHEYKIIGWGYYGEDDLNLTPKTWFSAIYRRVD